MISMMSFSLDFFNFKSMRLFGFRFFYSLRILAAYFMRFSDTKVFTYRYEFEPKPLLTFIKDRYQVLAQDATCAFFDRIRLNGCDVDEKSQLVSGDVLEYTHHRADEAEISYTPKVLFEDEYLLAIAKPDYLPVTPSNQYYYNSMAILAKEYFNNESLTPLHRLDLETSGVLLYGKNKPARRLFQMMFQDHHIEKNYEALTFRRIPQKEINGCLYLSNNSLIYTKQFLDTSGPGSSKTIIVRQEPWGQYFRIWCQPVTGKTNQLRAHFAAFNAPILGDKKYYHDENVYLDWYIHRDLDRVTDRIILKRQALHCSSVTFTHPVTQAHIEISDHDNPDWLEKIESVL